MAETRLRAGATGLFFISLALFLVAVVAPAPACFAQAGTSDIVEGLRNRLESAGVPAKLSIGGERIHASIGLPHQSD